jgi:hypothetical protein
MGNDLTKKNDFGTALMAVAEEHCAPDTFLKFDKGVYKVGKNEVAIGTEYIVHIRSMVWGQVKFEDGKLVDKKIGAVSDGFRMPKDLGDSYEPQYYLPFENPETGEIVVFRTGSQGGMGAVGALCKNVARSLHNGKPIVRIEASTYPHKEYGTVHVPVLRIVGWDADAHQHALNPLDDPPFDDGAPPIKVVPNDEPVDD